ncbi:MAG: hypothetical protein JSV88_24010 [Candidatus Aminicenantes bacterium]|nr:MAG: hypothetical protein JSV88_24010 [Candidatus Aminicenantes bacterium]
MLREIVRTQKNELTIKIPNEYLNKELEVFVLPLEPKKKSLAGIFKQYANKRLIEKESEIAWEKALKEKHDLS